MLYVASQPMRSIDFVMSQLDKGSKVTVLSGGTKEEIYKTSQLTAALTGNLRIEPTICSWTQGEEPYIHPSSWGNTIICTAKLGKDAQECLNLCANIAGNSEVYVLCDYPSIQPHEARIIARTLWGKNSMVVFPGIDEKYDLLRKKEFPLPCEDFVVIGNVHRDTSIAVCLPVKDEGDTLELCLQSFMPIADEMIISVDKNSKDKTMDIAKRYATKIIEHEYAGDFSAIRNPCMDLAKSDWIFMTEGHVYLHPSAIQYLGMMDHPEHGVPVQTPGVSVKLNLNGSYFYYPYLTRNRDFPDETGVMRPIRYIGKSHNYVPAPHGTEFLYMQNVELLHERPEAAEKKSFERRKKYNRKNMVMEARGYQRGSFRRLRIYMLLMNMYFDEKNNNKALSYARRRRKIYGESLTGESYHAAILEAVILRTLGKEPEAIQVLMECSKYDWARNEHFLFLGEICMDLGQVDKAKLFYSLASCYEKPISNMSIPESHYTIDPLMGMAKAHAIRGELDKAKEVMRKALNLDPGNETIIEQLTMVETKTKDPQEIPRYGC